MLQLLNGLTARQFLERHWQKRPLLVRGALPDFHGMAGAERDARMLLRLAARDDVESRVVLRHGGRWETEHGPFPQVSLQKTNATLLVSGVNLHSGAADRLLRRFAFIPQARLDDVMVSYATPGGGVGPHVDSYDVFLVQGPGRRRWKVWLSGGKTMQCIVEPGDLLYLPPGLKHDGVALDTCFTYSVGFRAPRGTELAAAFLDWLHERGLPEARYRDPRLEPAARPARLPPGMVAFARATLARIRWGAADVEEFLGRYLTEPKPHVRFEPGARTGARLDGAHVRLDPRTQMLYAGRRLFVNGEALTPPVRAAAALRALADRRELSGKALAREPAAALIYEWQRLGYLHIEKGRAA